MNEQLDMDNDSLDRDVVNVIARMLTNKYPVTQESKNSSRVITIGDLTSDFVMTLRWHATSKPLDVLRMVGRFTWSCRVVNAKNRQVLYVSSLTDATTSSIGTRISNHLESLSNANTMSDWNEFEAFAGLD